MLGCCPLTESAQHIKHKFVMHCLSAPLTVLHLMSELGSLDPALSVALMISESLAWPSLSKLQSAALAKAFHSTSAGWFSTEPVQSFSFPQNLSHILVFIVTAESEWLEISLLFYNEI